MKRLFACCLIVVSNVAWGDVLGFRASGGAFDYEISGTIRDGTVALDLKNNLGLSDKKETSGFVYIEHPLPVIPNIRLGTTSLKTTGSGTVNATFNGTTFSNVAVTSQLDLSHTEVALYYEIIDIGIDIDLGLNFKLFDGRATLTQTSAPSNTTTQKIDAVVPMLYVSLNLPIYSTGFSIGADFSTVSYDGNSLSDSLLRVRYETPYHLGLEAGVRNLALKIEDTSDNLYADIKIKGPYINLFLFF